jgi:tRNA (guanine26-N2/guanine27-N2)-dimethyltransferase
MFLSTIINIASMYVQFALVMDSSFVNAIEGRTTLLVPQSSLATKLPPKTPAFFNPSAKLNRDLSVVAYNAILPSISRKTFADAFTGIGARALRVAVEVPAIEKIYCNDINPIAIWAAEKAAQLNSVTSKCHFSINNVCKFLLNGDKEGERFGIVDLDPFGTPAKYVDCALRAVLDGGLVSITATDTAVLCGIYPKVCVRRYYGRPLNNSYGNEVAMRLLISLLALTASRLELSITPVFSHATMHYLRVYAFVTVSSSKANDVYNNLSYIMHCFNCGHRIKNEEHNCTSKCEFCGSLMCIGGQLWTGPTQDKELVKKMLYQEELPLKCKKILEASAEEISEIPYYYKTDEISAKLKTNPISVNRIIEKLKSSGFSASRAALNTSAFKTNANIYQIMDVLK